MSTSYNGIFSAIALEVLKEAYYEAFINLARQIEIDLFNKQLKDIIEEREIEKQIEPLRLQSLHAMRPKL